MPLSKVTIKAIQGGFLKLVNSGTYPDMDPDLAKRLRLTNGITLTILFFIVPYIFIFNFLGYRFPGLALIPIGLMFTPVFYLNRRGKTLSSRLLLVILMNIVLGTYAVYFGKETGIHLLFFVFLGIPFLIFSLNESWALIPGLILPVAAIYLIQYDYWSYALFLPEKVQKILYLCMITLIIIWTIMNYLYLSLANQKSENNFRRNEEKFRNLMESGPDAVLVCDEKRIIRIINKRLEMMFDYGREELLGMPFGVLIPKEYHATYPKYLDRLFSSSDGQFAVNQLELIAMRKNGQMFPVELMLSPLVSEGNKLAAVSIRDISVRKEVEKELIRYNQKLESKNVELEQFAFIASHDLQEPLRTVTSFTELLAVEYNEKFDETGKKSMEFITKATGRMSQLIKGLLDYSHLGRNSDITLIDLNVLVEGVKNDLAYAIEESKTQFEIDTLPEIRGYETELRQLFQNLISNAIKFRKKDTAPLIGISARQKDDYWEISVNDNGIGIEPAFNEKIFMLFQRLHGRDEYPGIGIGLAHCRKIVDLHNGKIWVDSQPFFGSTFYFTINL